MRISKVKIQNYRCFSDFEIDFPEDVTVLVGNNETGKSTILEAINLALTGKINGRSIFYEMTPYHFNRSAIDTFLEQIKTEDDKPSAPKIIIEVYFRDDVSAAEYKGRHNSEMEDVPGFTFTVSINEVEFGEEYIEYITNPDPRTVPIEYYSHTWITFAGDAIGPSAIQLDTALVDATNGRYDKGPESFMASLVKTLLKPKESAELRLRHRQLKEQFDREATVKTINDRIRGVTSDISDKEFSYSVDMSSRASWEAGFSTYLDSIPLQMIGKGEQTAIKARLALHRDNDDDDRLCLIEEPENHLSFSNMNRLVSKIREVCDGKQLIITTHSSFVANKLGLGHLVLLGKDGKKTSLSELSEETQRYFKKLPGYDTLRILLSKMPILVEGPSDELIVQKAYKAIHGKYPIEDGVDVFSIRGLSFKRFLEIAVLLKQPIRAVIDNDGDVASLKERYKEFALIDEIDLFWDDDEDYGTLEAQIVKANLVDLEPLNRALSKNLDAPGLINYMTKPANKTECALKIFESDEDIIIPDYINNAVA